MGSKKAADARIYPLTIQLRTRALLEKSLPTDGKARFVALPMKVVKKDVIITEMMVVLSRESVLFIAIHIERNALASHIQNNRRTIEDLFLVHTFTGCADRWI